jgi:hypothetical protein
MDYPGASRILEGGTTKVSYSATAGTYASIPERPDGAVVH